LKKYRKRIIRKSEVNKYRTTDSSSSSITINNHTNNNNNNSNDDNIPPVIVQEETIMEMDMSKFQVSYVANNSAKFNLVYCGVPSSDQFNKFIALDNPLLHKFMAELTADVQYIQSVLKVFKSENIKYHEQGDFQLLMSLFLKYVCEGISIFAPNTKYVWDANDVPLFVQHQTSIESKKENKQIIVRRETNFVGYTDLVITSQEKK
jgi:hypothetical protein